jgi:hypothetical protein
MLTAKGEVIELDVIGVFAANAYRLGSNDILADDFSIMRNNQLAGYVELPTPIGVGSHRTGVLNL